MDALTPPPGDSALPIAAAGGMENRGRDRIRRAGLGSLSAILAQGTALAVSFISIPLTVGYLGSERYGVWVTLSSLLAFLVISDLGFSSALVIVLARASGLDDRRVAQELVSTAFWGLMIVAGVFAVLAAAVVPLVHWQGVFNTSTAVSSSELRWAVAAALGVFVLTIPLTIVPSIYRAYQEIYVGNAWSITASAASLLALLVAVHLRGGLVALVLAVSGMRLLVQAVNGMFLFLRHRRWLLPRPDRAARGSFRVLSSLGGKYVVVRLAEMGMFQSHPIIVAQVLGASQVGVFYVAYRILSLPSTAVEVMTGPLLPAYAEAHARRDWPWIWRTLRRSCMAATAFTAVSVAVLYFITNPVIRHWAGAGLEAPRGLLVWLLVYTTINALITPVPVLLYAVERVGAQAVIGVVNAVVTIGLGVWLTRTHGLSGMAISMVLGFGVVNVTSQLRLLARLRRETHAELGSGPTTGEQSLNAALPAGS